MKTRYKSRMFSFTTAVFFTLACLTQASVNNVRAASIEQELLITEVMPMSQTTNDSYGYIELYNNTDRNIDLKDYKLPLQNIDITTSKIISPKGILVVCLKGSTTLDNFNTFYGTALTSDKYVTLPLVDETLSNSSTVNILLAKDDGTVVARAQYRSADFQVKKSVTYRYPETGFDMIRLGQNQKPTPGSISSNQVPQNGIKVTSVTLNKSFVTMDVNQTAALYATVAPATAYNKSIGWTSNNSNVVDINQNGVLTSKAEGVANITATTADGEFTAYCTVYVGNIPVTGINLDVANSSVGIGKAIILTSSVTPENATNKSVNWKSSNTNIAVVDSNGIVTGKAAGKATITATTADGNYSTVCNVTVYDVNAGINVTGISLEKTSVTITTGKVIILEAQITPFNAKNKQVTWSSSNNNVATVDYQNGIVTAKKSGTALITATTVNGGYKAYCNVTVTDDNSSYIPVSNIELSTNVIEMIKGENENLTASISPVDATNSLVTWSTDNTSVISVDSSGSISALNKGIAVVTAKTADGNLKDRCFVIVKDNENTDTDTGIFRIRLNKTSIRIKEGKFEKLTPIITPGNLKNTTLIWKSSDNTVASVTEDGRVFGEEVGTAIISVSTKDGQYSATCKVQVTNGKGFGNGNGKAKGHLK
jgi:Bacterial surface proteins containing Ig-like domains